MKHWSKIITGLVAAMALFATPNADAAGKRIVFAGGGGAYQEIVEKHWFKPFTKKTGIEIVYVSTASTGERRNQIQAMIKTNNMEWDLYQEGELEAEAPDHLTRVLDHTEFCKKEFDGKPGIPDDACNSNGVLFGRGLTLMTYNEKQFPNGGPKTWADFWDVKKYPGVRSMPNTRGWRHLIAALIADGVSLDKLFPLDLDRAFAKMDKLRPNIGVWWTSGSQTQQGFRDGEFDMAYMWMTRTTALKKEGQPIGWSFDGALVLGDRFAITKSAPNQELAKELLKFYIFNPEVQARITEDMTVVPPTPAALDFVNAETKARMPTPEQMAKSMVVPDFKYINENANMLAERWNTWFQK